MNSNVQGLYLDDRRFWVIFERAEKLGVPIFLHPTVPKIKELRNTYKYALAGPSFGFTFDTALCMMRLILSGVFDKYPSLKFVLGHFGESIPFILNRINFPFIRPWAAQNVEIRLSKLLSEYFKTNVFIGTSGEFHKPAIMCAIHTMGHDKVLFASDYPYEDSANTVQRIKSLQLSEEEEAKICCLNAKRLLNIH